MNTTPIAQIKTMLETCPADFLLQYAEALAGDNRKAAQALRLKAIRKHEAHQAELSRLETLNLYENNLYAQGSTYIAGVDEVGRGPLAGPVVAAAVILPKNCMLHGVNDSKKLSPEKRKQLFNKIKQEAISISIGIVNSQIIDEVNILNATLLAMRDAVMGLTVAPNALLVDAVTIPDVNIHQQPLIKGDEKSISIAAASIIAKVTRDAMMQAYSKFYPHYFFEENKGYGTKKHMDALAKFGATPIHRKSFLG